MPRAPEDSDDKPSRVRPNAQHLADKAAATAKIADWLRDPEKPDYIPRHRDEMHVLMRTLHDYCGKPVNEIVALMARQGCPVEEQKLQSCLRRTGIPSILPTKAFEAFVRVTAADAFTEKQITDMAYASQVLNTEPGLLAEPKPNKRAQRRQERESAPKGWRQE